MDYEILQFIIIIWIVYLIIYYDNFDFMYLIIYYNNFEKRARNWVQESKLARIQFFIQVFSLFCMMRDFCQFSLYSFLNLLERKLRDRTCYIYIYISLLYRVTCILLYIHVIKFARIVKLIRANFRPRVSHILARGGESRAMPGTKINNSLP